MPSDAELANQTLTEESTLRFASFTSNDAVTLGLSIRKRFRASSRHAKGKGLVLSIQSIGGHTLFACTVGDQDATGVSMDAWLSIEGMIRVVKRTGHSSFYVERGMNAIGKTQKQMGIPFPDYRLNGGAFPIWLQNSSVCPIAVVAAYGGSSQEDHNLVVGVVRDYLSKQASASPGEAQSTVA
ncbi:hypothetical protein EXIGLDRAFT_715890 [Exidia glandulosa HHB12029]|uniref:DUF336-domain-containing protein n=1 Tax=Exidia glandulosa HHB12029 TaxID=1314781 RepID=A0A165QN26_EXIGL|nr:hypothetical protein EXIGLDRAFT_715890 [Exidia glandulosa HHB12029]